MSRMFTRYGRVRWWMHVMIAVTFLLQLLFGFIMSWTSVWSTRRVFLFYHKSFGLLLFFLALGFVLQVLCSTRVVPVGVGIMRRMLIELVRVFLLIAVLLMPLSGWVMSTASGYIPQLFGWFSVPFPWVGGNPLLGARAHSVHLWLAWAVLVPLFLHLTGAAFHWWSEKNKR